MEEKVTTRYVFMMMLAISDRHGDVIGTDVAIARTMNVTLLEFVNSVKPLLSPDPSSNSQAEEGRRLVPSENGRGYRIVNYTAYRDMKSDDEKREYMRNYMRNRRLGKEKVTDVNIVKPCKDLLNDVTHTDTDTDAKKDKKTCPHAGVPEIAFIWSNSPSAGKMRSSKKQLVQAWKKLRVKPTIEELKTGLDAWNKCPKWRDGYAEGIHIWVTNEQWDNPPELDLLNATKPNGNQHKGIQETIQVKRL